MQLNKTMSVSCWTVLLTLLFCFSASSSANADGIDTVSGALPIGAGQTTALWVQPATLNSNVFIQTATPSSSAASLPSEAKLNVDGGIKIGTESGFSIGGTCQKAGTLTYAYSALYLCAGGTWKKLGQSFPLRENLCQKADGSFGKVYVVASTAADGNYMNPGWWGANGSVTLLTNMNTSIQGVIRYSDGNDCEVGATLTWWCNGSYSSPPGTPSCVNADATYGWPAFTVGWYSTKCADGSTRTTIYNQPENTSTGYQWYYWASGNGKVWCAMYWYCS